MEDKWEVGKSMTMDSNYNGTRMPLQFTTIREANKLF